jgi:hypothetical protein
METFWTNSFINSEFNISKNRFKYYKGDITVLIKIIKEAQWWILAARTAPFVALALLISFDYLNLTKLQETATIAVIISFITISVFWWWWAIYRIIDIVKTVKKSQENFEEIKSNIRETKKNIQ